ncbi:hypothetical protein ACCAA_590017 [Candidatus Accumulibacter aalborgensis]|uniref:Uncharacterized protein n=1 Tax=Candidatus Accumulibacter aalborgensis TaxID=1860102 RepID=A0A1A8XVI7_9PROT|nr:hypothetical protein ACCAA_590017 [Candidatus Accumulibacter aalborgensis]
MAPGFAWVLKRNFWNWLSIRRVRKPNKCALLSVGLVNLKNNTKVMARIPRYDLDGFS